MLDGQEGPDNQSVIETLNRLCSIVEEEPDLHAICNTFRSELSKYCPSEAIELLSYSNDPKELLRIASSTDEPGGSRIGSMTTPRAGSSSGNPTPSTFSQT